MANAKKIVVSNKEDQIKTINKINFDFDYVPNVTPIKKEDKTLNKADPRFSNDLVDQIRGSEVEISGIKTTNSENTKLVNELKIDQYVGLITHIAPLKLSASNNLTKADTRAISEDLVNECSMSSANAKILLGDKIAKMIYGKTKAVKNEDGIEEDMFVPTDLTADDIKIIEETLADAKRMRDAHDKSVKDSTKDQSEDNTQVKDTYNKLGL